MAKMRHDKATKRQNIKKFGYELPTGHSKPGSLSPPPPNSVNAEDALLLQITDPQERETWKTIREAYRNGIQLKSIHWQLVIGICSRPRLYNCHDWYLIGDAVSHADFGDGAVLDVSPTNISVLFEKEPKKLQHRRQANDPSPKREVLYEGAYHPKLKQLLLLVEESKADGLYVFLDEEGKTRRIAPDDLEPLETKSAAQFSEKQRHAHAAYLDQDEKRTGRLRSAEKQATEYLKTPAVLKILARWGSLNELFTGELKFLFQTAEEMLAGTASPHVSARAKRLLVQAVLGGFDPDAVPPPWSSRT